MPYVRKPVKSRENRDGKAQDLTADQYDGGVAIRGLDAEYGIWPLKRFRTISCVHEGAHGEINDNVDTVVGMVNLDLMDVRKFMHLQYVFWICIWLEALSRSLIRVTQTGGASHTRGSDSPPGLRRDRHLSGHDHASHTRGQSKSRRPCRIVLGMSLCYVRLRIASVDTTISDRPDVITLAAQSVPRNPRTPS
ncbi:hypothetical protein IBTHAUMO2_720040 [Nitrosopumilaceae archaeon]|nr:hypothetical protein IBTHAUMO2_720040 [Nitrosopumilaceae archaeon]